MAEAACLLAKEMKVTKLGIMSPFAAADGTEIQVSCGPVVGHIEEPAGSL